MTSQTSAKWSLDSCEAITRANYPPLLPRGALWAPIVWNGGVVRGAAIEVGMGKPTELHICGLGSKINTQPPLSRLYEESVYAQLKRKFTHYCYEWKWRGYR
jgi:hypothetical protein